METFRFWFLSTIIPEKIISFVLACLAAMTFFYIGIKYNSVRNKNGDKYFSNMIICAVVYQAIARVFDAYYMVSESDLWHFIYVVTKFYLPLDVLSMCFLTIIAITGFLNEDNETNNKKNNIVNRSISFISIGVTIIGILLTIVGYFPVYSPFVIGTIIAGCFFFLIILLLIARTCYNIFRTWSKMPPFRAMGFQLIFAILAMIFLILSEIGTGLSFTYEDLYRFKILKNASFLIIGILYYYSLIKPLLTTTKDT